MFVKSIESYYVVPLTGDRVWLYYICKLFFIPSQSAPSGFMCDIIIRFGPSYDSDF